MKTPKRIFYFLVLIFAWTFPAMQIIAQETVVVGQVFNKTDRAPLESVSVYFKGTNIHTQTNEEGYFLIRGKGQEKVLVFSLIGFKKEEIKVTPGESLGIEVLLTEKDNMLGEVFVTPGANPANDLMKKVRDNRRKNNVRANLKSNEQNLVFLSKKDSRWENNRIFQQFKAGNISEIDSTLLVPLYMEESTYNLSDKSKTQLSKNTFNTSETAEKTISTLLSGLSADINFYNNAIPILGKNMISPLANVGKTFYRYYLVDSVQTDLGKEYLLHFRSKNTKNLAFNGEMRIDSATYALTYMDAELPRQANLNFIHNLRLQQSFLSKEGFWLPKRESSAWDMTYELLKEANKKSPQLMINRSADYSQDGELIIRTDSFANSAFSQEELENKMAQMQQTPLYKVASYIADAALTGYMRAWMFDIGQIVDVARLTKQEGLRLTLPIRTNQYLWKNFMLGGHVGYGFGSQKIKYSTEAQLRLPIENTRIILGAKYLDDFRRIDYDYNNFLWREDPLATGDENIVSSIFSFKKRNRTSERREFTAFLYNDWTPDIESKWIFRNTTYLPNELLPFVRNGEEITSLQDRNFSLTTRFSFGERVIDEHFQRLYIKSSKPIIYATVEGGKFKFADEKGKYGKLSGTFMQRGQFLLGEWRYMVEAGKIFGDVPYPMLKFLQGKDATAYNRYEFSMMNGREYIADTYATLFTELITNGIILNNIPLIKHLNLREIASFKMAYGTLSDGHSRLMTIPESSGKFTQPYSEVSIGFCNLLGVASVQSIWRLLDLDKPNIKKWGIKVNLMLTF